MPLPASGARVVKSRFGRHSANGRDAVAPLPEAGEAATERGEPGTGKVARWAQAAEGRSTIRGRLGWHAVPTLPEAGEAD